ncbi:protein ASYMMETRIC LEAVES 2-like [Cannabis sativa]|uniref:protein ASYMMETRIC LEAVES 2-like n=1 Tax=Cannabis sativa TaxID=3483 RepID=UPI0029C9CA43|nr:protein ASYMMETRIC LEAVES 2-like [Cannabis sativa]
MTIKGGTTQACAACKYQRRKCSRECPLAPYFPSDQPQRFQHAHRLFGVRNILNILKLVTPFQRQDAMTSIIYESDMRKKFPVHGCVGIINLLQSQIEQSQEEIHEIHSKLFFLRQQQQHQQQQQIIATAVAADSNDHNAVLDQFQRVQIDHNNDTVMPHGAYFSNYDFLAEGNDDDGANLDHHQDLGHNNKEIIMKIHNQEDHANLIDMNEIAPHPQQLRQTLFFSPQDHHHQQQQQQHQHHNHGDYQEVVDLCYEDQCTAAFDTIVDDRQSFIESKDPCESSAESSMKHGTQNNNMKNEHPY